MQNSYLPETPEAQKARAQKDIWIGLGLTLLMHAIAAAVSGGLAFFLIGIVQVVYMIPAIIIAAVKNRGNIVLGLVIGLALTFLLNGVVCAGMLFSFNGIH